MTGAGPGQTVVAVVTAFRPERALLERVQAVLPAVDRLIVVDDGSGDDAAPVLRDLESAGARVVRLAENSGIATALNTGIRAAAEGPVTHVLTLDQDSRFDEAAVVRLLAAETAAAERGHAVAFSVPEFFAEVSQVHRRLDDGTLVTRHSIQSGMLIPMRTLEAVGAFRDDFFIDLVDTEFELRCDVSGLVGVAAPGLKLAHALGAQYERPRWLTLATLGFGPRVVTLSTPFRYYYRLRNRIVLNREYRRSRFAWVLRDTVIEYLHFAVAAMLARPRGGLRRLFAHAVRDAREGRMGRAREADLEHAKGIRWAAVPIPEVERSGS